MSRVNVITTFAYTGGYALAYLTKPDAWWYIVLAGATWAAASWAGDVIFDRGK